MPADNTLEILIKLGFIGADQADAARTAIADAKNATKEAGAADVDAAADAEKLNLKKREFHQLLHGLPPQLHQAGLAFTNLFYNPVFAGMLAVTAVFQIAKKHLDDYNKALDEMGKKAAEADFLPGIEAKLDVLRDGAAEMQKWLDQLDQEKSGEQGIAKALADQLGLMESLAKLKESQARADEALALAKIKEGQVSGRITPADAERQTAEVRAKAVADEQAAKEKAQRDKLATDSANLLVAEGMYKILKPIGEGAKQAQIDDEARQKQLKLDADAARAKLPDLNKAAADAAEKLGKAQRDLAANAPDVMPGGGSRTFAQIAAAAQTEYDKAQNALAQQNKILAAFAATQTPEAAAAAENLKVERERAEKLAEDQAKAIGSLKDSIAELSKTIAATTGPERAATRTKKQTLYTEGITKEEERAQADIKTIREFAGRPANSLSPADLAKIKNAIADRDAAIADAMALVRDLAAVGGDVRQARAEIETLKQQMKH